MDTRAKSLIGLHQTARRDYLLFHTDCGVTDCARRGVIYEEDMYRWLAECKYPLAGRTVVDVGANFGFHTLEFAELVGPKGKVVAFEPQRLVYYQLCGNIVLNGFSNTTAHHLALGDDAGIATIESPAYHWNGVNIGDAHLNQGAGEPVEVRTLDSFDLHDVAVVKIDVQGFEPKVLDGAKQTISREKPAIFIEVEEGQLVRYGHKPDAIFGRLNALGYKYVKTNNAPHLNDYVATARDLCPHCHSEKR